jgi:hypothetical protein
MKTILILLTIIFISSSCATIDKVKFIAVDPKEVYTTLINNEIEITFNEKGKFISVKVSVSEQIKIDLPGSKEIASVRALEKAKNILLNYIEKSSERPFLDPILQTLMVVKNEKNKIVAMRLSEDIKNKKEYIIKSLYLDREIYFRDSRTLNIIARSSTKFVKTTNQIKNIFK